MKGYKVVNVCIGAIAVLSYFWVMVVCGLIGYEGSLVVFLQTMLFFNSGNVFMFLYFIGMQRDKKREMTPAENAKLFLFWATIQALLPFAYWLIGLLIFS